MQDISIGCLYKSDLVAVMSFKSIDESNRYELISIWYKSSLQVDKILKETFNYFIKTYNAEEINTSIDISKYDHRDLVDLGFKIKSITEPDYIWSNETYSLNRDKADDAIMQSLGLYKIYDCGRMKLEWRK